MRHSPLEDARRSAVSIARFRTEPARKRDGLAQSVSALSEALHNPDLQVVVGVAAIGLLVTAVLARAFPISDVLNLIAQLD
jgi:hypothetical protein